MKTRKQSIIERIEDLQLSFKSHSLEEIAQAVATGERVFHLDTESDGEDDILLGDPSDIIDDILSFHELKNLPEHWQITEITELVLQ